MSCQFCAKAFGLKWLCACGTSYGAPNRSMREYGEEQMRKRQEEDPDEWYAAEVERMRERAPA